MRTLPLNDKRYLITGGASGLGLGAVRQLLRHGATVWIADINAAQGLQRASELNAQWGAGRTHFLPLDLTDAESIAAVVDRLSADTDSLDGLINNAGIYPPAQRQLTRAGRELCFEIAFTGHFALTLALMPLLDRSTDGCVVTVTSLVQRYASIHFNNLALDGVYVPIVAYAQAKLANLLFATELQRRLTVSGLRCRSYAAHPGVVRTALGANRPRADSDSAFQTFRYWFLSKGLAHFGQHPDSGARSLVWPLLDRHVPPGAFIGPRGWGQGFGAPAVQQPGPQARDAQLAALLWELGESLTERRLCGAETSEA